MESNFFKQILNNAEFEGLISEMELLVHQAQIKSANGNFEAQNDRIDRLRNFQYQYMESIEETRIINKRYYELISNQILQSEIIKKLEQRIKILEAANKF